MTAGLAVQAYRNLHKPGRTYSVRCRRTGLVVAHVAEIVLLDVTFRVQPGGRARVLAQRQRNVHAFAEGTVMLPSDADLLTTGTWWRASYNPYLAPTFVDVRTGQPLLTAAAAHLGADGLHYCADASA